METTTSLQKIECQQVLVDNGSVFSIQSCCFPVAIDALFTPENLLDRYLAHIRNCTCSIVRPIAPESGVEFCLLDTPFSLLSFLPAVTDADSVTIPVSGGLFVVQSGRESRGEFSLKIENVPGGTKVSLTLREFQPLFLGVPPPSKLRIWLYRLTHSAIHRLVTVSFLKLLYRELAGQPAKVMVLPVSIAEGQAL